jgi:hypothetical protein
MSKEDHAETATQGPSIARNPLHLKMLDALIDQAHVSAHITLSGIKGMQDMYMCGVRMMADTGKAFEDGCRIKIPLRREAAGFAEKTTSVFLRIQISIFKTSIDSTLHAAELLRNKLAENIHGLKQANHP